MLPPFLFLRPSAHVAAGFSSAPSPPNLTSCILSSPELQCALPAAATSRWCDVAADLRSFAVEVASMASLTGTSKLSASFEAAVKMLDQAAGGVVVVVGVVAVAAAAAVA